MASESELMGKLEEMGTISVQVPMANGFSPNLVFGQFLTPQGMMVEDFTEGEHFADLGYGQPDAWGCSRVVPTRIEDLIEAPHLERVSDSLKKRPIVFSLLQDQSHLRVGSILTRACSQVEIPLSIHKTSKPMAEAKVGLDRIAQLDAAALMTFPRTVGKCLVSAMRLSSCAVKSLAAVLANSIIDYLRSPHNTTPQDMVLTAGNIIAQPRFQLGGLVLRRHPNILEHCQGSAGNH